MEILFLVLLVLMFWLLMIRPAQKRQKAQAELQNSLEAGSEVMLTSGVFGVISDVSDPERLKVVIAEGIEIEVVRGAVASVIPQPGDDETEETDETDVDDAPEIDVDAVELDKPVERPASGDDAVDLDKRG